MQYFIGIKVPNNYSKTIQNIRESLNLKTTEPHITIIPPNILPNDDIFIKDLILCCSNISQFDIEIADIGKFDDRVIFLKINSSKISNVKNKIVNALNLTEEKRRFVPHLTILKRKYMNKTNIEKVQQIVKNKLPDKQNYIVTSLVVYQQKTDNAAFVPYMEIPLNSQNQI